MDLAQILSKATPWLAAAAAGPAGLAGMAVKTIAGALGADSQDQQALAAAVAGATPEQIAALKQAEMDFKVRMADLGFKEVTELESIAAGDRASARGMQIANKSFMPAVITAGILSSFAGVLVMLLFVPTPTANRDIIIYMAGQLSGFAGSAVAFWLGTTRQSEDKTHMLARAEPVK